jgi:hypothetical protein
MKQVSRLKMLFAAGFLVAGSGFATAGSVNISGAPSDWRGTLLDGADSLIATNSYGEPLFVFANHSVARAFEPGTVNADALVAFFKKACLETDFDEGKLAAAMREAPSAFQNKSISVPGAKDSGTFTASIWSSSAARVQIWSGDLSPLKDKQTLSRWRRGMTAMPFKANRVASPACNLTVMAKGFTDVSGFIDKLSKQIGSSPAKAVTKPGWADGYWLVSKAGGAETRVHYSMVDLDKTEQLLHVALVQSTARK